MINTVDLEPDGSRWTMKAERKVEAIFKSWGVTEYKYIPPDIARGRLAKCYMVLLEDGWRFAHEDDGCVNCHPTVFDQPSAMAAFWTHEMLSTAVLISGLHAQLREAQADLIRFENYHATELAQKPNWKPKAKESITKK